MPAGEQARGPAHQPPAMVVTPGRGHARVQGQAQTARPGQGQVRRCQGAPGRQGGVDGVNGAAEGAAQHVRAGVKTRAPSGPDGLGE